MSPPHNSVISGARSRPQMWLQSRKRKNARIFFIVGRGKVGKMQLIFREQSVEDRVDLIGYFLEILRVALEFCCVAIHNQKFARIVCNPFLVAFIQSSQVIDTDGLLEFSSSFADLRNQVGNGAADVNQQVRQSHQAHHQVEKLAVIREIAVAHITLGMQVRGKDPGIFEDGAVLNDGPLALGYFHHIAETLVQEVNLQIEGPTVHVSIEVFQIWIHVHGLEAWSPFIAFNQHVGQCGFAASNVSCDSDMHNSVSFEWFVFCCYKGKSP